MSSITSPRRALAAWRRAWALRPGAAGPVGRGGRLSGRLLGLLGRLLRNVFERVAGRLLRLGLLRWLLLLLLGCGVPAGGVAGGVCCGGVCAASERPRAQKQTGAISRRTRLKNFMPKHTFPLCASSKTVGSRGTFHGVQPIHEVV